MRREEEIERRVKERTGERRGGKKEKETDERRERRGELKPLNIQLNKLHPKYTMFPMTRARNSKKEILCVPQVNRTRPSKTSDYTASRQLGLRGREGRGREGGEGERW